MTKTLTEQWREGKIKEGFYYVRFYTGEIVYRHLSGNKPDKGFIKLGCLQEVLAPVPSYEEFQSYEKCADMLIDVNKKWEKTIKERKHLEKKLKIATKALKEINKNYRFTVAQDVVYKALKEMEGVK